MNSRTMILIGKVVVLLIAALGLPMLIWWFAQQHAARVDSGGPLSWGFGACSVPIAVVMYLLSRRAGRRGRVMLATIVVFLPLAGVCVAALIAGLSGVLVSITATNLPMLGASAGLQFGSLHALTRRRKRP